jgi:hypothetical protein
MVLTFAIVLIRSLGGHLHIGGSASIPLPWAAGHHLPILGLALPSRFVAYCFLIGGVLAAIWLADARSRGLGLCLAALSAVFLRPAIGQVFSRGMPDLPPLFTDSAYHDVITSRGSALLLPVGIGGYSMLWQAESGLRFKMAGGYVVPPEAPDPYKSRAQDELWSARLRASDRPHLAAGGSSASCRHGPGRCSSASRCALRCDCGRSRAQSGLSPPLPILMQRRLLSGRRGCGPSTHPRASAQPLISVLTPVHDPPLHMLEEAVASVRTQTFVDRELWLDNDGSPTRISSPRCSAPPPRTRAFASTDWRQLVGSLPQRTPLSGSLPASTWP